MGGLCGLILWVKEKMKSKNKAILYIICSAFCFAVMNASIRLAGDLPFMQKVFFRNFVAAIAAFFILKKNHIKLTCKKENRIYMFLRAFCGTLGMICNFYAIDHLMLADASMLNKMSPFFAVVFSAIILKDKPTAFQLCAVLTAFAGSLFIIKPTFANASLFPSLIGFLGGLGAGAAYAFVSKLGRGGEKGPVIVFVFSIFSCVTVLPYVILHFVPMSLYQTLMLLLTGFSAAGGQFSITAAYTHAPAREVSVFDYTQILFSTLLGFFLFGQVPDKWSFVGYGIIILAAVSMFLYNNRKTAK